MRTDLSRTLLLVLALAGAAATAASAQNAGPSPGGQVPGPNATPPQAAATSSGEQNSVQPVPGAMPGSDTVPSTLSPKNAADDKLITVAYTFKNLTDEQRRAIYQLLRDRPVPGPTPSGDLGVELPVSVELKPVPRDVAERVPQVGGYEYTVADNKVLLVSPPTRVVVGVLTE
jgi:hypothetical protein